VTAPVRFPRFFVTSPAPCPYLPGRSERKVFTELKGPHADALNDALGRIGFRRSQTVAYRPSCLDCNACVSVRVVADEFRASATQKRNLKAQCDLIATLPALVDQRTVRTAPALSRRAPSRRRHGDDGRSRFRRHGRAHARRPAT
jgi:arginyl-tRNA--protein-N-Asp/Glu arginylyltransferase